MSLLDTHWILCPVCRGKTRTQIREDTVLENFPLFCPKCRRTFLISMRGQKTEYLCQPEDAELNLRAKTGSLCVFTRYKRPFWAFY